MSKVPYLSAGRSLMYAMVCTRPDICHAVGMAINRIQVKSIGRQSKVF